MQYSIRLNGVEFTLSEKSHIFNFNKYGKLNKFITKKIYCITNLVMIITPHKY
jgi:hypothetical protein